MMSGYKRLSPDAFRRMMEHLSAEQLRELPDSLLPDPIPVEIVDEISDPAKRGVIEELIWSRSNQDLALSRDVQDTLSGPVLAALETVDGSHGSGSEELDRLVTQVSQDQGRKSLNEDWLDDSDQTLKRARELGRTLSTELMSLERAAAVLESRPSEDVAKRVATAHKRARHIIDKLYPVLRRYHLLELDIAHREMKFRQWQCESSLVRMRELDKSIQVVSEKLEYQRRLTVRLLRPRLAQRQRETLLERLQKLTRQRDEVEIPLSEEELLHWLDVLTDASLLIDADMLQNQAQRKRLLLYRLLNAYCLQQEESARRVASNPLSQVDAREAIEYFLGSEKFILRYFSEKRQDVTLWVAGAARERLETLERVRDLILSDYRRTTRLHGHSSDAARLTPGAQSGSQLESPG